MPLDPERTGELCAILAKRFPDARPTLLARAVVAAQRAAIRARAQEERRCNVPMTEEQDTRMRLSMSRQEDLVTRDLGMVCGDPSSLMIAVSLGGDPRGTCGRLLLKAPDGEAWLPGDGFGGDGFPLY